LKSGALLPFILVGMFCWDPEEEDLLYHTVLYYTVSPHPSDLFEIATGMYSTVVDSETRHDD